MELYEDTLTIEELRREIRCEWDDKACLIRDLRDLPEVPSYRTMLYLSRAAKWPDDNEIGMHMQRQLGYKIPYKSECEGGTGLWFKIRYGILNAKL